MLQMPADPRHDGGHTARLVLLAVVGAGLVWLILSRTLAAYLAVAAPASALLLQAYEPTALVELAKTELEAALPPPTDSAGEAAREHQQILAKPDDERLSALSKLAERAMREQPDDAPAAAAADPAKSPATPALSPQSARRIRELAAKAVAAKPVNADAIGILAKLAELSDDPDRTETLMTAAARLSIRESPAVYWLLQRAERDGDDAAVLRYADTLLRTRNGTFPLVIRPMARIAEKKGAMPELTALLTTNPPWRPTFMARLTGSITDARTPLLLLLALQGTAHPPTPAERAGYIRFLVGRKFYELAYYTWLQFQPPEELPRIGPLNNRSFETTPSGLPFDWVLSQGASATAEIRPLADQEDQSALAVEFGQGRVEFPGVTQLTLLAPGTYVLTGKYRGRLLGIRGLVWRSNCAGGPPLAQSEPLKGDIPDWRPFSMTFTVPPTGCRAQQMRLDLDARSASEKMVSGSLWFDDLDLRRGR